MSFFFVRVLVFEIWSILYWKIRNCFMHVRGPSLPKPPVFGGRSFCIWSTIDKIDHISKLKVVQKKTRELKNHFQDNAHLSWKFYHYWIKSFFSYPYLGQDQKLFYYSHSKLKSSTVKILSICSIPTEREQTENKYLQDTYLCVWIRHSHDTVWNEFPVLRRSMGNNFLS